MRSILLAGFTSLSFAISAFGQVTALPTPFLSPFEYRVSLAPSVWGTPRPIFNTAASLTANNNATFAATKTVDLGSSGKHNDASDTFGVITPGSGNSAASLTVSFIVPVVAFGGVWGSATVNAVPAPIDFQFSDFGGHSVGPSQTIAFIRNGSDGALEWHGWTFATPVSSITVTAPQVLAFDFLVARPDLHLVQTLAQDGFHVSFTPLPSQSSYTYWVEQTSSLHNPVQWKSAGSFFGNPAAPVTFIDHGATNQTAGQIYRVRIEY